MDEELNLRILEARKKRREQVRATPYRERRYGLCSWESRQLCGKCYGGVGPEALGPCLCPPCRCDQCSHY